MCQFRNKVPRICARTRHVCKYTQMCTRYNLESIGRPSTFAWRETLSAITGIVCCAWLRVFGTVDCRREHLWRPTYLACPWKPVRPGNRGGKCRTDVKYTASVAHAFVGSSIEFRRTPVCTAADNVLYNKIERLPPAWFISYSYERETRVAFVAEIGDKLHTGRTDMFLIGTNRMH